MNTENQGQSKPDGRPTTLPGFNPTGNEAVAEIKQRTEDLLRMIEAAVPDGWRKRDAMRDYEKAAMLAVKAIFATGDEAPVQSDTVLYRDKDGSVYPAMVVRVWSDQCLNLLIVRDEFTDEKPQTEILTSVVRYRPEEDVLNERWFLRGRG